MKTAHDVKLLNGSKQEVSYSGVETVTMPGTDGHDKVFTAGTPIDAMDIQPDFSGGDMPLEAPEGNVVRSATIKKPEGAELLIAKGQSLAGISGEYVTPGTSKEIEPDFKDCLVIDSPEDVSAFLSDRGNIGKYVKYVGETGDYTYGQFYKAVDEYEFFDPNGCPATAVEVTSDTSLTATLEGCDAGDFVVAAFAIRSELVSLSDGWTLISTSQSTTEINHSNSTNQTLSFAYKYATSTTEELTITQKTSGRIYINMVSLSGVSGFADAGYQYQDNTNVSDTSVANFARPAGRVIIWGATRSIWVTKSPYPVWELSNDSRLIQIGSSSQSRLLLAIDKSEDVYVTFYSGVISSTDAYTCGALSIELEQALHLVQVDKSEVPTTDTQTVTAEGDERWSELTVKKPETLVPGNILNGVEVAGVTGTLRNTDIGLIMTGTASFVDTSTAQYVKSGFFSGYSNLEYVSLAQCSYVGSYGFYSCTRLSYVSLPICEQIHNSAFYSCISLSVIHIPNCTSIGNDAFRYCSTLEAVDIPKCSYLGTQAFQFCSSIQNVNAPDVKSIPAGCFNGCSNLTTFTAGKIESIGSYAFYNCTNLSSVDTDNCKYIGGYAFYGANAVSIDTSNLVNIGSNVFSSANKYVYTSSTGGRYYNDICLSAGMNSSGIMQGTRLVAPYVYGTTALNFGNTVISLPDSIEYIADLAFNNQTGIRIIGDLPNLKRIGSWAFSNCGYLASINLSIPNCSYIGNGAFSSAGWYSAYSHSLYAPNVSYIGDHCFMSCYQKSIYLTLSSKIIVGASAFYNCIKTYISNSVITIMSDVKAGTFYNCVVINPVVSFSNTKSIQSSAFYGCKSIPAVIFNNSQICSLYTYAFYGCSLLSSVYLLGSKVSLMTTNVFTNTPMSNATYLGRFGSIYVPESMYSVYTTADYWSSYSSRFVSMTDEEVENFLNSWEDGTT